MWLQHLLHYCINNNSLRHSSDGHWALSDWIKHWHGYKQKYAGGWWIICKMHSVIFLLLDQLVVCKHVISSQTLSAWRQSCESILHFNYCVCGQLHNNTHLLIPCEECFEWTLTSFRAPQCEGSVAWHSTEASHCLPSVQCTQPSVTARTSSRSLGAFRHVSDTNPVMMWRNDSE